MVWLQPEYVSLIALPTLYRYMQQDKIPCFKLGNRWRFKKSILERLCLSSADNIVG